MNDVAAIAPPTTEYVHSFRRNPLSAERTFRLRDGGLEWQAENSSSFVPYRDIVEIREYKSKVRGPLSARLPRRFDYVLLRRDGARIAVNSRHRAGLLTAEDRTASCTALIAELRRRVAAANPDARFVSQPRWSFRLGVAAQRLRDWIGFLLLQLMRRTDLDRTANFVGAAMRRIGPWLRGHRTARLNLSAAYPEKSASEIERILADMWDNLGRLGVEYANLDRLLGDSGGRPDRIVFAPGALERLARLREDGKPALLFSAHLANYEVGAIVSTRRGLDTAVLYRRPNLGPLTDEIVRMRANLMGHIISADRESVWRIREALKRGLHVAMLVDQHFPKGAEVTFFGRRCRVNPMPARYAQRFGCPVHGVRAIRLPDNRIQLELTEEVAMPRGRDGKIDVAAAMQAITATVEGWIRENPAQWPWLQRRWR